MNVNRLYLDRTARDCVCATCWSPLVVVFEVGEWALRCSKYREAHAFEGVWQKSSVDRRRGESAIEASEVRRIFAGTAWGDAVGIPRRDMTPEGFARRKAALGRDSGELF